jgi:hypothetical protein
MRSEKEIREKLRKIQDECHEWEECCNKERASELYTQIKILMWVLEEEE